MYLAQSNVVYVQDSFADITDQESCKNHCDNPKTNCTFWTFSYSGHGEDPDDDHDNHHHNRVKRNHQGISQCGIR